MNYEDSKVISNLLKKKYKQLKKIGYELRKKWNKKNLPRIIRRK